MSQSDDAQENLPWNRLRAARIAVATVFFVHGAALAGFASFLPVIKERLHLSASGVGNSILFSPLGAVLALPFLSKLFTRFGTRRVLAWTGAGLCLAIPFAIDAQSPWALRLSLLCTGALAAALDAAMNAEAVQVQKRYPTPMMSSSHGCWSLGGFVGGGFVALTRGFQVEPVVHAAVVSAILLIVLWFAESRLLPHVLETATEEAPSIVLPKGILIPIGLLMMLAFGSEATGFDWIAVYLRQSMRTTESMAALGFGIFSGAMATSRLLGDFVVHRLGHKRTLEWGGAIAAAGFLAGVNAPTPLLAIAGFVLGGLAIANIVPILFQAAGSVKGVATGSGIAAVSTMGYGMFLLAPPLVGYVSDRSSLSVGIGLFGTGVLGVALFGPAILKRTTIKDEPAASPAL